MGLVQPSKQSVPVLALAPFLMEHHNHSRLVVSLVVTKIAIYHLIEMSLIFNAGIDSGSALQIRADVRTKDLLLLT